ncbi:MAG: endonuclease/exonuclease/phosphatase family protein [Planctomycetota bacterium]
MRSILAAAAALSLLSSCANRQEIEILSWNILHGANADGELNLGEKRDFLAESSADLIFLQEVDQNCERSGNVDQMQFLAEGTARVPGFGSFMSFQGGEYGMGMLSSLPVLEYRSLRLPDGNEPRVALIMEAEVCGQAFVAANVHFNWIRDDTARYAQAQALLEHLNHLGYATVVAGDFNDVPESRTLKLFLDAGFTQIDPIEPSFSSENPRIDIDHVLIRGNEFLSLAGLGGRVIDGRKLSDHRPVRARIRAERK